MTLVTPTELARICTEAGNEITKQAAHKAVKEGIIPHVLQGKRKMIDLDDVNIKHYIKGSNRQREAAKKKDVTPKTKIDINKDLNELLSLIVPEERPAIKKLSKTMPHVIKPMLEQARKLANENKKSVKRSKKPAAKTTKSTNRSTVQHDENDELSDHEIKRRTNIAKMKKAEHDLEVSEKKRLPVELVDKFYVSYIEKLHTNLERAAGVYIQEVGKSILSEGEVLPEHIEKWINIVLEAMHNNKKSVKREFKKYEP